MGRVDPRRAVPRPRLVNPGRGQPDRPASFYAPIGGGPARSAVRLADAPEARVVVLLSRHERACPVRVEVRSARRFGTGITALRGSESTAEGVGGPEIAGGLAGPLCHVADHVADTADAGPVGSRARFRRSQPSASVGLGLLHPDHTHARGHARRAPISPRVLGLSRVRSLEPPLVLGR